MHKSVQRSLRYVLVFLYSESVELADYKEQPGMCRFLFKSLFSLTEESHHLIHSSVKRDFKFYCWASLSVMGCFVVVVV